MNASGAGDEIAGYFEVLPNASLFSSPSGTDNIHRTILDGMERANVLYPKKQY